MADRVPVLMAYRICRSDELTECFHWIVGAYLQCNAWSGGELGHHHRILLHDAFVDLQELLGVCFVQRTHQHRRHLKATLSDLPDNVTGDTCRQTMCRCVPDIFPYSYK